MLLCFTVCGYPCNVIYNSPNSNFITGFISKKSPKMTKDCCFEEGENLKIDNSGNTNWKLI